MKKLLLLACLVGCAQPLAPTPMTGRILQAVDTRDLDAVASVIGTCKWRDMQVRAFIDAGATAPNIFLLNDGLHKVYLDYIIREPSYTWYLFFVDGIGDPEHGIPEHWCTIL